MATRFSKVPQVRAELLRQLKAAPGLVGVSIDIGNPVNAGEDDMIWIGDVAMDETAPTQAPTLPRDERWVQEVIISVAHGGMDNLASETRAFELYDEARSVLLTDPRQSNKALWVLPLGLDLENLGGAMHVETRITWRVDCRARS